MLDDPDVDDNFVNALFFVSLAEKTHAIEIHFVGVIF